MRRNLLGAREYYRTRPVEWIEDWVETYDPRNAGQPDKMARMPFVLFLRQREMVQWLQSCVHEQRDGLAEKCRDAGATWVCCAFSVWLWLYQDGAAVGWGSRKADLVDKIGDPDSIFEKLRMILEQLPTEMLPAGFEMSRHCSYMKIMNPATGATITGESGDNIGRGGRKLIYFKDESAHYERAEKIEASLGDNTNVQIDISSVNGTGNVFHRRRQSGEIWTPGCTLPDGATSIFVFDWRDHPAKDEAWYAKRRAKAEREGMMHVLAQEVDRDYAAAVTGVVIPAAWVAAAVDAHVKLGFEASGERIAALDVADEGPDKNALVSRHGVVMTACENWADLDTYLAAERAIEMCEPGTTELYYDCIGVGAGVKGATNKMARDDAEDGGTRIPRKLRILPWNAAAAVLSPDDFVIPDDDESPTNGDHFKNLKAQGWWMLRTRFEKTWRMVNGQDEYDHDELISIPSDLPNRIALVEQLSQPTYSRSPTGKIVVDKAPDGMRSPDMGDGTMMCYWPADRSHDFAIVRT